MRIVFFQLVLFLFVQNTFATADFYDNAHYKAGRIIYRLGGLTENADFQALNKQQKAKAQEKYFKERRRDINCVAAKPLAAAAVYSVCGIMSYRMLSLLAKESEAGTGVEAQPGFFLTSFLTTAWAALIYPIFWHYGEDMAQTMTGLLSSFKNCKYRNAKAQEDELGKLEIQYMRNKLDYSAKWQEIIETNFLAARQNYRMRSQYLQPSREENPHLVFAKHALGIPLNTKPLKFSKDDAAGKLERYSHMETGAFEQLQFFCKSMQLSSQQHNANVQLHPYLLGAPGTGKTEAVQIVGKLFDVPVVVINLAEIDNIHELKGVAPQTDFRSPKGRPGILAEKLAMLDTRTAIVFFDNADRVLNKDKDGQMNDIATFMLELFENGNTKIYNPYFGADLDLSGITFVLAGNSAIRWSALEDRLETMIFGGYSLDYRKHAAKNIFLPKILSKLGISKDSIKLSDDELENIAKDEHAKLDSNSPVLTEPGFRTLQSYIHKLVLSKLLSKKE